VTSDLKVPMPPQRRRSTRVSAVIAAALIAGSVGERSATAQQIAGFAEDRFEPAGAGSAWMSLESLDFAGHLQPTFGAVGDWAWKPLVFYDTGGHEVASLVRQQAVFNADASLTLWSRARVDLDLPFIAVDSGADVQIRDQTYAAPRGLGIGDVRLGADARLFGRPHDVIRIGAGALLFVPTGSTQSFTGDGGFRFWPKLMLAGEKGRFIWAAQLGIHLRPRDSCGCDLAPGSELSLGAAVGWQISQRVLARAELYGSDGLSSGGAFGKASPPAEILMSGRIALTPRWRLDVGVAPGLSNGPGSPVVRGLLGVQYEMASPTTPRPTSTDSPISPQWPTEPASPP
jgi:OOP family OmpA-OmpF porin